MSFLIIFFYLNLFRFYPDFLSESAAELLGGRLTDLALIFIALFLFLKKGSIQINNNVRILLFLAILICVQGLTLIFSGTNDTNLISIKDFYEPFRLFLLIFFYLVGANTTLFSNFKFLKTTFTIALLLFFFIVIFHIFDISVGKTFVDIFFGSSKDKVVLEQFLFRQTGFFSNPNWAGLFLSWALSFVIFVKPYSKILNFFVVLLCFLLVLITGSRTGLICSITVFAFYIYMKIGWRTWIFLGIFVIGFSYLINFETFVQFLPLHNRDLARAIFEFGNLREVKTFSDRIEIWNGALDFYFYNNYLFGTGPLKSLTGSVFDSQYIKWLIWYGSVGLIVHALFFLSLFLNVLKISNRTLGVQRRISESLVVMHIVLGVSCLTGAYWDNTQLSFFLMMLTGSLNRSFSDGISSGNSVNLSSREVSR
jgi:hypothetical protein